MQGVSEETIGCPCCGENVSILVDPSVPEQEYTEDCQVCCRPIVLRVTVDATGEVSVLARSESE
jgi:hypothetical protein